VFLKSRTAWDFEKEKRPKVSKGNAQFKMEDSPGIDFSERGERE